MSRRPTNTAPSAGAADAAAAFADGHVDPVPPIGGADPLRQADPLAAVREAERAALTEDVLETGVTPSYILILCGTPGFRRGGFMHPARAEYPLDAFTSEQLDAFAEEPRIELVTVGGAPIPRATRLFGADPLPAALPRDPRLAGDAAAAAISDPPNRAAPGLRNAAAGYSPATVIGVR